jgi:hypothetical protein
MVQVEVVVLLLQEQLELLRQVVLVGLVRLLQLMELQ